jgi:DNA-binding XRE family transcriptional regulator
MALVANRLRNFREALLISKFDLARKAGVALLTIDRIEKGFSCRPETKRKVLAALGIHPWEKEKIFPRS